MCMKCKINKRLRLQAVLLDMYTRKQIKHSDYCITEFVGVYGKLDVLYAGIVTENACAENKNRFLVFFDDGFAQYLPVKKLHHVYHTGRVQLWHTH